MCALALLFRLVPDYPVVLAANRDEFYDRPSSPPERVAARIPYVAPRDLQAGGTWIGTNAAGLTAAVTNRKDGEDVADRPSRGELVREALSFGSAAAARNHLDRWLRARRWNGFHLLFADAYDAYLIRGGEEVRVQRLEPGSHVVTNLHEYGDIELLSVDLIAQGATDRSLLDTVGELIEVLRETDPQTPDGFAPCKDFGDRGTRSSTVIARGEPGRARGLYLHADGPPNRTPFEDYASLLS